MITIERSRLEELPIEQDSEEEKKKKVPHRERKREETKPSREEEKKKIPVILKFFDIPHLDETPMYITFTPVWKIPLRCLYIDIPIEEDPSIIRFDFCYPLRLYYVTENISDTFTTFNLYVGHDISFLKVYNNFASRTFLMKIELFSECHEYVSMIFNQIPSDNFDVISKIRISDFPYPFLRFKHPKLRFKKLKRLIVSPGTFDGLIFRQYELLPEDVFDDNEIPKLEFSQYNVIKYCPEPYFTPIVSLSSKEEILIRPIVLCVPKLKLLVPFDEEYLDESIPIQLMFVRGKISEKGRKMSRKLEKVEEEIRGRTHGIKSEIVWPIIRSYPKDFSIGISSESQLIYVYGPYEYEFVTSLLSLEILDMGRSPNIMVVHDGIAKRIRELSKTVLTKEDEKLNLMLFTERLMSLDRYLSDDIHDYYRMILIRNEVEISEEKVAKKGKEKEKKEEFLSLHLVKNVIRKMLNKGILRYIVVYDPTVLEMDEYEILRELKSRYAKLVREFSKVSVVHITPVDSQNLAEYVRLLMKIFAISKRWEGDLLNQIRLINEEIYAHANKYLHLNDLVGILKRYTFTALHELRENFESDKEIRKILERFRKRYEYKPKTYKLENESEEHYVMKLLVLYTLLKLEKIGCIKIQEENNEKVLEIEYDLRNLFRLSEGVREGEDFEDLKNKYEDLQSLQSVLFYEPEPKTTIVTTERELPKSYVDIYAKVLDEEGNKTLFIEVETLKNIHYPIDFVKTKISRILGYLEDILSDEQKYYEILENLGKVEIWVVIPFRKLLIYNSNELKKLLYSIKAFSKCYKDKIKVNAELFLADLHECTLLSFEEFLSGVRG